MSALPYDPVGAMVLGIATDENVSPDFRATLAALFAPPASALFTPEPDARLAGEDPDELEERA